MQKSGFIRKTRLISKFMTPQPRKQTTAMHILPNISRSNDNQTKKPGDLIKPNMKNIFFCEKSYSGKTIPRLFSENSKSSMSLYQ